MDRDFGNWLAGFIDGEGCFQIKRSPHRLGHASYRCYFNLTVRMDEQPIIEEIIEQTGLGYMKFERARKPTHAPGVRWSIEAKGQVLDLIALLDEHPLRAKKLNDYRIWRAAALEWAKVTSGSRGDWSKMETLFVDIREARTYRGPAQPVGRG